MLLLTSPEWQHILHVWKVPGIEDLPPQELVQRGQVVIPDRRKVIFYVQFKNARAIFRMPIAGQILNNDMVYLASMAGSTLLPTGILDQIQSLALVSCNIDVSSGE